MDYRTICFHVERAIEAADRFTRADDSTSGATTSGATSRAQRGGVLDSAYAVLPSRRSGHTKSG